MVKFNVIAQEVLKITCIAQGRRQLSPGNCPPSPGG